MNAKSLARLGFDVNARLNGLDPKSEIAEERWRQNSVRIPWEHIAEAIEAEVLRRHGITVLAASVKPVVDILKITRDMCR